jgi:hypothetical protein
LGFWASFSKGVANIEAFGLSAKLDRKIFGFLSQPLESEPKIFAITSAGFI